MKKLKFVLGLIACIVGVFAFTETSEAAVPVYRSYNRNNGDHYYTGNWSEHNSLVNSGWKSEGVGWYAPDISVYSIPVQIMYNRNTGEHLFTLSTNEIGNLQASGWANHGSTFRATPVKTAQTPIAVYRLYNPYGTNAGRHVFTTYSSEANSLMGAGWLHEGAVFWVAGQGHS